MTTNTERHSFRKRTTLIAGALVAVLCVSSLLAACGSSGSSSSTDNTAANGSADFGTLDYQLSWIKNTEFAGEYIADSSGFYKDAGFSSVNLIAGGPSVAQDAVVAAGKAFIGISAPDITAPAILKGAPLVAIAALFQKNPFAVMSLASNPINTPQDMIGKKIGVQAVNEPIWAAFLEANNIDPASITKVPAQFDPQPLVAGEVDGWFSFYTNEPNLLASQGIATTTFLLNDYNYPMVSQIFVVRKDSLTKDREKIKAILLADIKGWLASIKDPTAGPQLTISKYGKDLGLDLAEQTLESKAQNKLIVTPDTQANGIMTLTPSLIAQTISTLKLAGVQISAEQLFDTSVLAEVYAAHPELKTVPTPG